MVFVKLGIEKKIRSQFSIWWTLVCNGNPGLILARPKMHGDSEDGVIDTSGSQVSIIWLLQSLSYNVSRLLPLDGINVKYGISLFHPIGKKVECLENHYLQSWIYLDSTLEKWRQCHFYNYPAKVIRQQKIWTVINLN